jgi:hypothetical protein
MRNFNGNDLLEPRRKRLKKVYFNLNKINIEDYEGIKYPTIDTKRAVIDKMLADKLNEFFRILDVLEEKRRN